MKMIFSLLTLGFLILAKTTLLNHASIPAELSGKWIMMSKPAGFTATLEITKAGSYSHSLVIGSIETGKIAHVQPGKLQLISRNQAGKNDTTLVSYKLVGQQLEFNLVGFHHQPKAGLPTINSWVGSK